MYCLLFLVETLTIFYQKQSCLIKIKLYLTHVCIYDLNSILLIKFKYIISKHWINDESQAITTIIISSQLATTYLSLPLIVSNNLIVTTKYFWDKIFNCKWWLGCCYFLIVRLKFISCAFVWSLTFSLTFFFLI